MTPDEQALTLLVGRMDGKLDLLLQRSEGFDKRIRAVEKKVWWSTGAAAVISAFIMPHLKSAFGF